MKGNKEEIDYKKNNEIRDIPFIVEEVCFLVKNYYFLAYKWCGLLVHYGDELKRTDADKLLFFSNLYDLGLPLSSLEKRIVRERLLKYTHLLTKILNKE